jgi:hypothetical protein
MFCAKKSSLHTDDSRDHHAYFFDQKVQFCIEQEEVEGIQENP